MNASHPSDEQPNRDHPHGDETAPSDDSLDVPFTTGPLVDDLSSGVAAPPDDDLARLLAGWRDDITTDLPSAEPSRAVPSRLARVVALRPRHQPQPAGRRRVARVTVAGVAVFTMLAAGTGVAAASWRSTPDSPLWPVAEVLYPDHAHAVAIEDTIDRARRALRAGKLTQAADLINAARAQLASADLAEKTAGRLRRQIDALISDLAAAVANPPTGPAPPPTPPTPPASSAPTAAPSAAPGTPAPAPTRPFPAPTPTRGLHLPMPGLLPIPEASPSPLVTPPSSPPPSPTPSPSAGDGLCLPLLPCLAPDPVVGDPIGSPAPS